METQRPDDFRGCVGVLIIILLLLSMIFLFSCTEPKREIVYLPTLPNDVNTTCPRCKTIFVVNIHEWETDSMKGKNEHND